MNLSPTKNYEKYVGSKTSLMFAYWRAMRNAADTGRELINTHFIYSGKLRFLLNVEIMIGFNLWFSRRWQKFTVWTLSSTYCVWNQTRHPLSTGIFSAKHVTHQHGFEPTTSCLPTDVPRWLKDSNYYLLKAKWSNKWSNKVEFRQNSETKRNIEYDFPPPLYKGGK